MENNQLADRLRLSTMLAVAGAVAFTGFVTLFYNIPWEWNMFMDDIYYGTWMSKVTDIPEAMKSEILTYWQAGRFYPVKYLANLLKWKYLPNDPYVFRSFNLAVFTLFSAMGAAAAIKAGRARLDKYSLLFLVFLVGSALLHKPLLEAISLNPLGETWVCFFFALGAWLLFSENAFCRYGLARVSFLLVALSKEPAALVFFASCAHYLLLAYRIPSKRKFFLAQAVLDLALFGLFFVLALYAMANGTFTKQAYFASTPWLLYAKNFVYKIARYALWTSPFCLAILLGGKKLCRILLSGADENARVSAGALFFFCFGAGYSVFMATQGIVAYQEIPSSISFFCLFGLLAFLLLREGELERQFKKFGALFLVLFLVSYFVSVSRWERFIRGIVEPNRAIVNLLSTGQEMTVFIPPGEVLGHVTILAKELNPAATVLSLAAEPADIEKNLKGTVYVTEFPIYMGPLSPESLESIHRRVEGWSSVSGGDSYKFYRGRKTF